MRAVFRCGPREASKHRSESISFWHGRYPGFYLSTDAYPRFGARRDLLFPEVKVKLRMIKKADLGFRGGYQTLIRGFYLPSGHYGQVHPGLRSNGRANRRAASGASAWRAELDLMSSPLRLLRGERPLQVSPQSGTRRMVSAHAVHAASGRS